MAKYICTVCGEIYDEDIEGVKFSDLPDDWSCPKCRAKKSVFMPFMETGKKGEKQFSAKDLEMDPNLVLHDNGVMDEIHKMAVTGKSIGEAMDTLMPVPNFDDILILGAQLSRFPKADGADVNIRTVIGKDAKRPMEIEMPVYVSHMSFGALSASAKVALAKGTAIAKTAMCSGEGGALEDEMMSSYRYIFEYIPNKYSVNEKTFSNSAAIEIKIGQGTKPGMGGHLPGEKVTERIAAIRGKPMGKDILSPSKFDEIDSPEGLKRMVDELRSKSNGLPIGVKIAAGHIEEDLEFISGSGCDFITIDGRGGATGSSPKYLKDASSVPTVYALARARRYMDEHKMKQQLVITGGLRTSRDFIKALAMGADAIAISSAALMALGCQRYRICDTGKCPIGIATQDPVLEARLDVDKGARRVANYLETVANELRSFTRVTGHDDVHELSTDDLCTISSEISEHTGIRHA